MRAGREALPLHVGRNLEGRDDRRPGSLGERNRVGDVVEMAVRDQNVVGLYFIDGNLWIHSSPTYSYKLVNDNGEPVTITIVVRGNITISDNIFYGDAANDGLILMAIEDPLQADSGNIYFGDPGGGTLEYMDAYMYAENDFLDYNLSASGSKNVVLNGNMTAGNQVNIDRDVVNADGTISHSQLVVQFDDRVASGELSMPGLPSWIGATGDFQVLAWREVTSTQGVDIFTKSGTGGDNKLSFYQDTLAQ